MSGGRRCPDCGSSDVVEDAHYSQEQLVCADCGCILTEGVLTTTLQEESFLQAVRFSDSTGQNESISRYKLKGIMRVRNLCRVLRLPDNFADTAVTYYEQAFDHAMFHSVSVEKKEAIVGCCVYITCRQFHWPVTMGTISTMLYSKQELFTKMFSQLVQSLNLDVPSAGLQDMVQSHCKSFKLFQNSPSAPPEYAETLDKVLARTQQILELGSETWLVTGRHPIPIITVAAFLSWQSLRPVHRLSCKLPQFCKLCEIDKPSPAGERMREFLEIFIKLAQQLPWLKMFTLNKKTVVQHLGDILQHRQYLLRKALAAAEESPSASGDIKPSEQPIHTSPFLPPCVKKPKKRSYKRAFSEGKEVTGDEEILDSEIEQYLRTPAEVKEFQDAQAKILNH
ncbi:transcription factor IIIB 50 kDa subunit [Hyperolius riggenbachi]|uniref:transcription factor IIIB 50 kDa subunit n=1 Tax=Hyperolius riggenbachi TaxID=752182 RepID=UPI0035A2E3A1